MKDIVILFVGSGILVIIAALTDSNIFMNSKNSRHIVEKMGKEGAKAYFLKLGIFLLLLGGFFHASFLYKYEQ